MYLLKKNKKIHTFESSLFIGQSYFHNDGAKLYLTLPDLVGPRLTFVVYIPRTKNVEAIRLDEFS